MLPFIHRLVYHFVSNIFHVMHCLHLCVCVCVPLKSLGLYDYRDLVCNICLVSISLLFFVEMTPLFS